VEEIIGGNSRYCSDESERKIKAPLSGIHFGLVFRQTNQVRTNTKTANAHSGTITALDKKLSIIHYAAIHREVSPEILKTV
jgi:hypothetical protein